MTDILMPALSPTMEEGTLAKWHVKVGDAVKSGDVIAEIETDKATMEVEAVDDGVIDALLVGEGTEGVKVNAPIARLKQEGEAAGSAPVKPPSPDSPVPPANAEERGKAVSQTISSSLGEGQPRSGGRGDASTQTADWPRVMASPLAKRLAAHLGLDLTTVRGSGPHGRIIRRDVEAMSGAPQLTAAAPAESPRQLRSLEQMGIAPGTYDLTPLDGMKKTVARRMSESFRDVPHFPLTIDLELDALLAGRAAINALLEADGVKVSVNDLIIKATATALRRVPDANASYTPEGIARHHHADIAVAVAIQGGLITPIVRAAETKGVAQIASEMKDLAQKARDRKLKPEEYQGGTFSISNLGMFGIKSFASIINEPQGAILSVGVGEKRPVVVGDALTIATVMSVTLTCDHRVIDGVIGSKFLQASKAMIEDPIAMIV